MGTLRETKIFIPHTTSLHDTYDIHGTSERELISKDPSELSHSKGWMAYIDWTIV